MNLGLKMSVARLGVDEEKGVRWCGLWALMAWEPS